MLMLALATQFWNARRMLSVAALFKSGLRLLAEPLILVPSGTMLSVMLEPFGHGLPKTAGTERSSRCSNVSFTVGRISACLGGAKRRIRKHCPNRGTALLTLI